VEFATCPPGTEWLPGCDWLPNTAADAAESVEHFFGVSTPTVSGPPPTPPESTLDSIMKWCDCDGGVASVVLPNANSNDVYGLTCTSGARCAKRHNKQPECLTAAQVNKPKPPPPCPPGYTHRGPNCVANCPPNHVLRNGWCRGCPNGTAAFFIMEGYETPGMCVETRASELALQAEQLWLPGCADANCRSAIDVLAMAFANDATDPTHIDPGANGYAGLVSNLRATRYDLTAKTLAACSRDPHHHWVDTNCECVDGYVQSTDGTCYRPTIKTVRPCAAGTWSATGYAPERLLSCARCPAGQVSARDHRSCETCGVAFVPASDAGSCKFKKLTEQHGFTGKVQAPPPKIH
jgi:hypothetical protein